MYLRRESGGRSRDEAVEILFSLGFGLEFGRLVQQLLSGLLPQSFLLRAIIRWICGRGGRLGDVLSLQRWAIPARHDLTRCQAHTLFAAHSSQSVQPHDAGLIECHSACRIGATPVAQISRSASMTTPSTDYSSNLFTLLLRGQLSSSTVTITHGQSLQPSPRFHFSRSIELRPLLLPASHDPGERSTCNLH